MEKPALKPKNAMVRRIGTGTDRVASLCAGAAKRVNAPSLPLSVTFQHFGNGAAKKTRLLESAAIETPWWRS